MTRRRFGSVSRRSKGVYLVQWTEGERRKSRTIRGTMRDVDRFLALTEMRVKGAGPAIQDPDTTVSELWDEFVVPTFSSISAKTEREYTRLYERELKPRIGDRAVRSLTWKRLQKDLIDPIEAPSVQRSVGRLLSKMLRIAQKEELIESAPLTSFDYRKSTPRQKRLVDTLTCREFIRKVEGIKVEPVILLMLGGGLRLEEAAAMRWEYMEQVEQGDRSYVKVDIKQTLVTNPNALQQSTKTDDSRRVMVIGDPFASRLLKLLNDRKEGAVMPSGRAVGTNTLQEFTLQSTISHNWRTWCEGRGQKLEDGTRRRIGAAKDRDVEYVRLGDMRTCWSTMQSESGSPDSLISMAMGHRDGNTRERHYLKATMRLLVMLADNLTDSIA